MKKILFGCLTMSLFALGCEKNCSESADEIPVCIEQRIQQIKSQPKWNPPAKIDEYKYQGRTVYLISSPCCDRQDTLVDINCNFICAPTGGITGKGDGRCTDFTETARHVRVVLKMIENN